MATVEAKVGAQVVAAGPAGERTIPVEKLFAGYYETVLARNELITGVVIPAQGSRRAAYLKCTTRAVHDWPALGVAVALDGSNGTLKSSRVVVSAATSKAMRLKSAEKLLAGQKIDNKLLAQAGDAAAEEADILADIRGSASYKREILRVYIGRAVRAAMQGAN